MSKMLERKGSNINAPTLEVSSADAGKIIGVDEDGNLALVSGGGGGNADVVLVPTGYDSELNWVTGTITDEQITQINNLGTVVVDGRSNDYTVGTSLEGTVVKFSAFSFQPSAILCYSSEMMALNDTSAYIDAAIAINLEQNIWELPVYSD